MNFLKYPTKSLSQSEVIDHLPKKIRLKSLIKRLILCLLVIAPILSGMTAYYGNGLFEEIVQLTAFSTIFAFFLLPVSFILGIYAWWQAYRFCMAYGEPVYGKFLLATSGFAGAPTVKVDMYPEGTTVAEAKAWLYSPERQGQIANPAYPMAASRPISTNLAWLEPATVPDEPLIFEGRMIRDPDTQEILLIEPLYDTSWFTLVFYWFLYVGIFSILFLCNLGTLLFGLPHPMWG